MSAPRRWPLLLMMGALYFVQGIVEPTASLPAQPLQTWLEAGGHGPERIGQFFGLIGLGWSVKPLYGLCSDFVPLFGKHRLSYLLLSTLASSVGFFTLSTLFSSNGVTLAQWVLFGIGVALAVTDVVVDAVAVEHGQPLGLTGVIQSVQWGAISVASLIAGVGGGWVASVIERLPAAWIACGVFTLGSCALVALTLREPHRDTAPRSDLKLAVREIRTTGKAKTLGAVALFLFLLNFNPFSSNVLKHYSTESLGISEQTYGALLSVQAAAGIAACVAYGVFCRRVAFHRLLHLAVASAILSTIAYWALEGPISAVISNAAFGASYQLSTLITLDLAARVCPRASAATIFAALMAVCNWGTLLGFTLGGGWYEQLIGLFGDHVAFDVLVGIGGLATATGWLVVPVLRRVGA